MCCHATDVRLERALVKSSVYMGNGWFSCGVLPASRVGARRIERPDGGWRVLMRCAATDVRLEWVLVESSV